VGAGWELDGSLVGAGWDLSWSWVGAGWELGGACCIFMSTRYLEARFTELLTGLFYYL
jgi:hypothetical protein